jgi:hypothetical protein
MRSSSWTPEDALAAGRRFLAQYGTLPKSPDLRARYGLPSGTMIRHLFGSLRQFQERLAPAGGRVPAPPPPRRAVSTTSSPLPRRTAGTASIRTVRPRRTGTRPSSGWAEVCAGKRPTRRVPASATSLLFATGGAGSGRRRGASAAAPAKRLGARMVLPHHPCVAGGGVL